MGGKTPATTTQTSTTKLSPQQESLFNLAFPMAQQYASTPLQQFSGSGVAGFTPAQTSAQEQLTAGAGTANNLAGQSANAQSMLLDPNFMLNPNSNPWLQTQADQLAQQLTRSLTEQQLPSIRSGATVAGGQYSGGATRQGVAEGVATGRTNEAMSHGIADLMFNAYNRGLTGMEGAVNNNANVQAQQGVGAMMTGAVGDQQQAMQQALLNEQVQKFYTGQALPFLQSQELMSLLTGMPGGSNVSTATGAVPAPSLLSMLMGGSASAAGLAGAGKSLGLWGAGAGAGAAAPAGIDAAGALLPLLLL